MSRARAVVVLAALLVVSGCSSAQQGSRHESKASQLALIRATSSFDYEPFDSPELMLENVDVGASGEVSEIASSYYRYPNENTGAVVVKLHVTNWWKSEDEKPDALNFIVHRPTNVDLSEYDEVFASGTRIAFFGYRAEKRAVPVSEELPLYEAAGQGLIIESDSETGQLVNVWSDDPAGGWPGVRTMSNLAAALD